MNGKIAKQIFVVFIFSAIPALLSYLASSSLVFDKLIGYGLLGDTINVPLIQDYCLWIGIIFSAFVLSINLIITKVKCDYLLEQRNSLIKMNKNILSSDLGRRFLSDSSSFDIRIFIPKHPLMYKIADKFHISNLPRKFVIKNIDLIADQGITKNLQFEVFPKQEGLVGLCYQGKSIIYDDDLEHTNNQIYQLNHNQLDRTSDLKWSICCPVCDDVDNVVAIIALDGKTRITIDKEKEEKLREPLIVFTRMLYDAVPQLFKR